MHRFSDQEKYDIGLVPQALNNSNVTGPYHDMALYRTLIAVLQVGPMAAGKTATLELFQATDVAGDGVKNIPPTPATELATATITANANVTEATLTLAVVVAGNAVTINGVTFAAVAAGASGNQFNVGANDTATATNLAAAINAAAIGVVASANATVVTLDQLKPNPTGEVLITVTNPSATITVATTQAFAFIDLLVNKLDITNGFSWIAAKVTTTANTVVGVQFIRDGYRFTPFHQLAGASAVV